MSLFKVGDRVVSCTTQARGVVEVVDLNNKYSTDVAYEVLWDGAGCLAFVWEKYLEPLVIPETQTFAEAEASETAARHDIQPGSIEDLARVPAVRAANPAVGVNPKDIIGATKPDLSLVPSALIIQVAEAMRNGAAKYGAYNWRETKVQVMTYLAAGLRHIYQYMDGEEYAEDSGVHHLAHAAACFGIVLDAIATGNLVDNRPTAGAASRLIADLTKGK